jgi:hypothetical protein
VTSELAQPEAKLGDHEFTGKERDGMTEGYRGRRLATAARAWARQHDGARLGVDMDSFATGLERSDIPIGGDKPMETLRSAINRAHDLFDRSDALWTWKEDQTSTTDVLLAGRALADVAHEMWLARWGPERLTHYQDLTSAVERAGHAISGIDKAATLRSAIGRDDRFVNAARGQWRLRARPTRP